MDVLVKAVQSLWVVLLVGLVLGAGLPALFALGVRSLDASRTVTVGAGGGGRAASRPGGWGLAGAVVCFAILIAAVLFGIVVIIFGNRIFG